MYKKFQPYGEWIALQHSEYKAERGGNEFDPSIIFWSQDKIKTNCENIMMQ